MKALKITILFAILISAFSFSVSASEVFLDEVNPGSLADWYIYNSGYNPSFTYEEITSPYDGSTAIKTAVSGNTVMYCDTKYINRIFDVGTKNTENTDLKAYMEFWSDLTYYNFPYVVVQLLDNDDNVVGSHVWYGKDVVAGLYKDVHIPSSPQSYTELPSDKGYFTLDFSDFGSNIEFTKIRFYIDDYTCIGNNYVILDNLKMVSSSEPVPESEFVIVSGTITDGSDNPIEGASVEVTCNDNIEMATTQADGVYHVQYYNGDCNVGDNVEVLVTYNDMQGSSSGTVESEKCIVDAAIVDVTIPEFATFGLIAAALAGLAIFAFKRR